MKKSVLTIIGVIGIISIVFLITIPQEKLQLINLPFIKNKENQEKMKLISNNFPSDYKNGYFYIKKNNLRNNIMFFDYDSKKEVYLCNKPNCAHDTEECSSYSKFSEANQLFYYDNALYIINTSALIDTITSSTSGEIDKNSEPPSTIYKMKLDGTEKQKVFVAPNGSKISIPFVMNDKIIYGYLEKRKIEGDGIFTSKLNERKLIQIDLETGKYKEIKDSLYGTLIGVYENKLVIEEIEYKKDPRSLEDNTDAYIDNLYNSKIKIKLLDTKTQKEEVIYEDTYKNLERRQYYKNGIYFTGNKSKKLEYIDISTKKKETISELPKSDMELSPIIDDKLLIHTYKQSDAYYFDLNTKELHKFTLKDKNDNIVEILSSNEDYYFVKTENVYGNEYTTWAGTTQKEYLGDNYGLIKKEDYWASKANYIKMTKAK